jgi:hypothetical protein
MILLTLRFASQFSRRSVPAATLTAFINPDSPGNFQVNQKYESYQDQKRLLPNYCNLLHFSFNLAFFILDILPTLTATQYNAGFFAHTWIFSQMPDRRFDRSDVLLLLDQQADLLDQKS